jgi:hypothetical protein
MSSSETTLFKYLISIFLFLSYKIVILTTITVIIVMFNLSTNIIIHHQNCIHRENHIIVNKNIIINK